MKRFFLLLCFNMILSGVILAQGNADDIIGYYYLEDPFSGEASQVYIYKTSEGVYEGKICWVEVAEKKKFIGLVFLKELPYNPESGEWGTGTITYPGKKGNFKVNARFDEKDVLRVRGFWGFSMMGKTVYWKKESAQRVQE